MRIANIKTELDNSISNTVFWGVRLGGMGISIGSSVVNELAEKIK